LWGIEEGRLPKDTPAHVLGSWRVDGDLK